MTTAAVMGLGVAAAALGARQTIISIERWMLSPRALRQFYHGGFEEVMTKREAALILGVRESTKKNKIMEAHRRVMKANHPDSGGSPYVSMKVNEAKEVLLGKKPSAKSGL